MRSTKSRPLMLAATMLLTGLLTGALPRVEAREQSAADRLAAVENDIPPPIVVAGEPVEKWTIEKQLKQYKVPAVSVAVINDYKIDWAKAWGVTEAGGTQAVTKDTLFQAASISKPITAMAVMHLVQEGKLNLDVNVNDYLKQWKVADNQFTRIKPVTLRELLTHSAGIPTTFEGYPRNAMLPSLTEMLEGVPPSTNWPITVQWAPGSKWVYSNAGYGIVQQVVVDVTGESFPEFMKSTLLQPLGMTHSTYEQPLPAALEKSAASGTLENGLEIPYKLWVSVPAAAGGLSTTPSDIARFAIALMKTSQGRGNPVISAATGAEILTQINATWGDAQGLGVALSPSSKFMGERFSHEGSTRGFKTLMIGYLSGRGIIVMTNSDNGMAAALPIIRAVEHVYGWNTYPLAGN
jgi:CubicO group peptidase (beta-lactamase class C family)